MNALFVKAQALPDEMSFILTLWLVQEQFSVIKREPGPSAFALFSLPNSVGPTRNITIRPDFACIESGEWICQLEIAQARWPTKPQSGHEALQGVDDKASIPRSAHSRIMNQVA